MTEEHAEDSHPDSFRSPLLMNCDDTALVVVDVQEKLIPHIQHSEELVWNVGRLIEGASILGVPLFFTEQYPKGLGSTISALGAQAPDAPVFEKTMFSCRECSGLFEKLKSSNISKVLLVGIEAHVCVMQSALDFIAAGYDVYVCIDAAGSRFEEDGMTAMQRMETSGVSLVSCEMALFEWCTKAGSAEFKQISKLVQEQSPVEN